MKKTIRYTTRIFGALLALLLLAWLLIGGYILFNKKSLVERARKEISNRTGGEAKIGDLEITFFRHFPDITLHVTGIALRDSLWSIHHHDLLQAENTWIHLSFFSLFSGHPRINRIAIQQGSVYVLTDSTGYSNTYLLHFQQKDLAIQKEKDKKNSAPLPEISLDSFKVTVDQQDKHKIFEFAIRQLYCTIDRVDRSLFFHTQTDMQVGNLVFNQEKGSFIKDQRLEGDFTIQYNTASHIIQFNQVTLRLNEHPFQFSGRFFPNVSPDPFLLNIDTRAIPYRQASALLTPELHQKLDEYNVSTPVDLSATLDAGSADNPDLLISVRMNLNKGDVTTPAGTFANASFAADFTNEWIKGIKRGDPNSRIRLRSFSGTWSNIPLHADTINITDLKNPQLSTDIHSTFRLERLNEIAGSPNLQFRSGTCIAALSYKGPLSAKDSTPATLNGNIGLDTVSVGLVSNQLLLTNCSGKVRFAGRDFFVDKLEAHTGNSVVRLEGAAKNLVALINNPKAKVSTDWTITSSRLDLRDFIGMIGDRQETAGSSRKGNSFFETAFGNIDQYLKEGTVHLHMEATDISYKKFSGAHARGDLFSTPDGITLNSMQLAQESGSMSLSGTLRRQQRGTRNPITIQARLDRISLPKLFSAFDNFGQRGLRDKNLKGTLTADIKLNGLLTNKADIVPNSLKGNIDFSIQGGQLLNYEPMIKIQEAAFKKRDLSEIRFAELKNRLDLDTGTAYIHRMEINSTAFVLFIEGFYDWKKGPDLSVQVPLSNLKKRDVQGNPSNQGVNSRTGISARLRVRNDENGNLKITWDPFKKALRRTKTN